MAAGGADRITLRLYLHRDERDAWLVSLSGVGAGVYLPKSEIEIEGMSAPPSGPAQPVGGPSRLHGPVGPVNVELPRWLAEDRGLVSQADEKQGSLW